MSTSLPDTSEPVTSANIASTGSVDLAPGACVGRYIVLHRAGVGAMGVVYAAHDPELDRRVAIKLLHSSRCNEVGKSRVLSEARAMAKLSHPNVVGVYEVGTLGEQLFVAMEFVEGVTLHDWLAAKPRRWREVVEVMAGAARGLAAAHDSGIVHRDIKPTNIIVTSTGTARVLDFGLARAAEPPRVTSVILTGSGVARVLDASQVRAAESPPVIGTQSGVFSKASKPPRAEVGLDRLETAGTPAYMAPEHFQGAASAKSDQYAFCATLYEALFGRRPDPVGAASVTRYENPGRATPKLGEGLVRKGGGIPTWLWRAIRRGLNTYPEARHASMHVLADELSRKPEQRRLKLIALTASIACLATAAVAASREFAPRSDDPCASAATAASAAWGDAERSALDSAFSAVGRSYAPETARRVGELLEARTDAWSSMRREACAATWAQGTQSQQLLDLRMSCLDRRLSEQQALTKLMVHGVDADVVDKSIQAVRSLPSLASCADTQALLAAYPPPADPVIARQVEKIEAKVDQARALSLAGRYKAAVAILAPGRSTAERLKHPPLTAELLLELSFSQAEEGDVEGAERSLASALPAAALARDDALLAMVMARWIYVVGYLEDRHAEALAAVPFAEALALRTGPDSESQIELLNAAGGSHLGQGDYVAARHAFERALLIAERLYDAGDPRRSAALINLGLVVSYQGKDREAIEPLRKGVKVAESALGADHPQVAVGLNNLGMALRQTGESAEALQCFERALAIFERAHGPNHPDVGMVLSNLADSARLAGRLDDAKALAERGVEIQTKVYGADNHRTALSMRALGDALRARQEYAASEAILWRALSILEKALAPDHPFTVEVRVGLARNKLAGGQLTDAGKILEPALKLAESQRLIELPEVQVLLAEVLFSDSTTRPRALVLAAQAEEILSKRDSPSTAKQQELDGLRAWLAQPTAQTARVALQAMLSAK